jgi:hypothetical protein
MLFDYFHFSMVPYFHTGIALFSHSCMALKFSYRSRSLKPPLMTSNFIPRFGWLVGGGHSNMPSMSYASSLGPSILTIVSSKWFRSLLNIRAQPCLENNQFVSGNNHWLWIPLGVIILKVNLSCLANNCSTLLAYSLLFDSESWLLCRSFYLWL